MEHCQRGFDISRYRADIDIHANNFNRYLDWLSDSCRHRSWMWDADGKCGGAEAGGDLTNVPVLSP